MGLMSWLLGKKQSREFTPARRRRQRARRTRNRRRRDLVKAQHKRLRRNGRDHAGRKP